jgi:hypothetical protein
MLELKREAERALLREKLSANYLPPVADPRNNRPNTDFQRLEFSAETHIIGDERRPLYRIGATAISRSVMASSTTGYTHRWTRA